MTGPDSLSADEPRLARRLGSFDAIALGVGSMLGAGVFAVFAPAADAAGSWLLVGLLIAALVAFANATSTAQLAAAYPESGGVYVYGRRQLGEWAGFLAGWSFVVGKTASCAAMAMAVASYVAPGVARPVSVAVIVLVTAVNLAGVTRTVLATKVIVVIVLAALAAMVGGVWISAIAVPIPLDGTPGWYGVLQSAGLLFFAFAGYARVATLGEEVRDPRRVIPRAIVTSLAIVLVVYAVVAVTLLAVLGPVALADSSAPLQELARRAGASWVLALVNFSAGIAIVGALLSLMAGVSRTTLAMARGGDVPAWLGAVHHRSQVPHHAELLLAGVLCVVVLFTDLTSVIGFSSFGVLLYYLIANVSALTQQREDRRYPRLLQWIGVLGCVVLTVTLPWKSVVAGITVIAAGVVYRLIWLRRRRNPAGEARS